MERLRAGAARTCKDFHRDIALRFAQPLRLIREKKLLDLRNLDEESEEEEPYAREPPNQASSQV